MKTLLIVIAVGVGGLAFIGSLAGEDTGSLAGEDTAPPSVEFVGPVVRDGNGNVKRTAHEINASPTPQPPAPTWRTLHFTNEFGEQTDLGAASEVKQPVERMGFPYQSVNARIFVNCDRAWVRFNDHPNLTGGEAQSGGYSNHQVRFRVDGKQMRSFPGALAFGGDDLLFHGSRFISMLSSARTVEMVVQWYDEGPVVFKWSMIGSSDVIAQSCD